MARSVHIETTIPGAYFDERDDVVSRFQRHQTQLWWRVYRQQYELYTSEAVLAELRQGSFPQQDEAVRLLEGVPVLPVDEEIGGVARAYVEHLVMPRGHMGDSFHLAFACIHALDYLLTWNCRHLANPRKVAHIAEINRRLGLLTPTILTPQMLVEEDFE
ncbi:MAG: type II toxin-antitoxin system VapC family toxin [Phycisphaerae bacterium]|nr:type II toxin-antitoxin system VapC family toxin [Phycisphaerae bacterium]